MVNKQSFIIYFLSLQKQGTENKQSLDPWVHPTLSKVTPDEDGTANAHDEVDVQKGFHEGVFLQGDDGGFCFARGLLLAPAALHPTEPQDGPCRSGLLRGRVT